MKQMLFALALLCVAAPAWAQQDALQDRVIQYESSDQRMNAAIEQARSTLPLFLSEFSVAPVDMRERFVLKVGLPTPDGGHEHIWINNLRMEGANLVGDLANDPDSLPSLHFGSRVVIEQALISDWIYQAPEGIYGGYTMRVMIDDLPPAEAAPYRASLATSVVPPTWVP